MISYRLIMVMVLFLLSAIVGCLFLIMGHISFAVISFVVALLWIAVVVKLFSDNASKVSLMFNAIENKDFTFRFSEVSSFGNQHLLNRSLNRIKELMQQNQIEIYERERYYENILNHSTSGILVIDPLTGIIHQSNQAAIDMLAMGNFSHINRLSVISPEIPRTMMEIQTGQSRSISFHNETSEVCLTLSASNVQLKGREFKIVSFNNIRQDIEGAETDSWIRLSRVLTHEIMNSLAPVTSLSDQLLTVTDPQTIRQGLEIINYTSQSLITFVESYRKLTRMPTPVMEEFLLADMLKKQTALIDSPIDTTQVSPTIHLMADPNLLGQVVINLLRNAVDATQNGGQIWLRAYSDPKGRPTIEVCNSGEIMSGEVRENIFVPFFTTKTNGNGIGLSLSRQIMRLHGGGLSCSSQVVNGKNLTVFTMSL